ncbi:MAG: S-methyl-5-thioribose kinase [Epulopiscium sp. Nuni2H_MBin001]|nr:MAG: S-methyl-5-thioribose kinase [Epulopiscium sp. Nuni2H_MBin001]
MAEFNKYFLMKAPEAILYAKEKLDIFDADEEIEAKEIGDGNLNYVFKITSLKSGQSVIVKQAGREARISADIKLSTDRARIEAQALLQQDKLAPGIVPKVYLFDEVMSATIMEDLSDYTIMRTALINHQIFPEFAEHISTFMVNNLVGTSDICIEHKAKKDMVRSYINPELCEISEQLVYSEPFHDAMGRNNVYAPMADFVQKELYDDAKLKLEVAKLKFEFMTHGQALLHGDLHTGSIFVTPTLTKVFDPEFAFYGPMGYDIGNVIANLFFAWLNGEATIEDISEKKIFLDWIESTVEDIVELFKHKYDKFFDANVTDDMAQTDGFKEWYLEEVLTDTAAVAGLEMIRRIVGLANVKDITTILDENARVRAEKVCILVGKRFIMNSKQYRTGRQFVDTLKDVASERI